MTRYNYYDVAERKLNGKYVGKYYYRKESDEYIRIESAELNRKGKGKSFRQKDILVDNAGVEWLRATVDYLIKRKCWLEVKFEDED